MVTVTASGSNALRPGDFNFDRLTDIDSVIATKSSTSLVILVDGLRYAFSGTGVRYNSYDEPIAGTITGFTISRNGNTLFEVTGLGIPATTFYLATYAPNNPFALVFAGNDDIRGGAQDDNFQDLWGHNVLMGGAGADSIVAGDGNDHIYGQSPNGGTDGNDTIFAGGGSDYVNGNAGNDTIDGGGGSDRIQGGADNDSVTGQDGNDTLNGNRGDDAIDGGAGNDSLRGGQGNDTLSGGEGDDILFGDRGIDQLIGGAGKDLFFFGPDTSPFGAKLDRIQDFQHGEDHVVLGFVPAAVLTGVGDPYAGAGGSVVGGALTAAQHVIDEHAGNLEVAIIQVIHQTYMLWDADGNGSIDSFIDVSLSSGLTAVYDASDFI